MPRMEHVLAEFSRLLKERLRRGVHTTEDSVRYTFFAALLRSASIDPHEVVLEWPHPKIERGLVDAYVPNLGGRSIAIEFKYDRESPSGSSVPRPRKAGAVFSDLRKLSLLSAGLEMDRLLIYCTDRIMSRYFRNPRNGHVDFFELSPGHTLHIGPAYVGRKPATFRRVLGGTLLTDLESLWSEHLPREHELRVFRILPIEVA